MGYPPDDLVILRKPEVVSRIVVLGISSLETKGVGGSLCSLRENDVIEGAIFS